MKKLILYISFMALYGVASAQMQMNMPMSTKKKTTSKSVPDKKMPVKARDDMKGMDMPMAKPVAALPVVSGDKTLKLESPPPHTVRYDLYVKDTMVNYSGKPRKAIAVNGGLPAPTLYFTEGDTAEIYVHNTLTEETVIHWHGVILPNQYDGVPFLTTQPIEPGATHLFKFPIVQHGTHFYHTHLGLQQQIGLYGALVFYKRNERPAKEYTMVLSDWTDMNPKKVNRSLHNATDWFAIQKGTTQSYAEAIRSGNFKTKLTNEWKRMNAMDVSDVYYDKFLINGKPEDYQPQFKAGDKVRLRVTNGGSSTYFWLTWAGGKMTVIANDGNDVVPVEVDRLIIGVAETYDVVVTIPKDASYQFLVTPEDRTKSAALWLGKGEKVSAPHLPKLKYFAGMKMMNGMMNMNGNMKPMDGMEMGNQVMDMNTVMYPEITGDEKPKGNAKAKTGDMAGMDMGTTANKPMPKDNSMAGMDMGNSATDIVTLNYAMLRSPTKTTLPPGPVKNLYFELTGNMNRYVWSINNKTLSEADKILIKKGENVRIVLYNNTMMRHPMHLHGHDFRVLNGQGDYSPLKNTLDIMPMEQDTIEFAASYSGDWFFHCHILYHMMSGMGRVFEYENSPPNPEITDPVMDYKMVKMDDQMPYLKARVGLESNGSDGQIMVSNTRWQATEMWNLGYNDKKGYESETTVGRYIGKMQWLLPYVGFDYHYKRFDPNDKNIFGSEATTLFGQKSDKFNRHTVIAGLAYTLPMLVVADARVDGNGKFRFQLAREDVPVSKRLRFNLMVNTDKEYAAGLRYIVTKYFSVSTRYDSDMGFGGGLTLTY
jgi:CopA family copper-resistance protein